MDWVCLITSVLICSELLLRSRLVPEFALLVETNKKLISVIGSKHISDHWKELALPKYAFRASASSLMLLVHLFAVLSPILLFLILDHFVDLGLEKLILELEAIAASTLIAIVYLRFRRR